ncbi:MAG: 4a-hydroxytetrahydrobiopterin dehydratase [Acidobacteriota bacterium]
MAHRFFVSYRRDDTSAEALNVRSALRQHFGDDCAFMDTSSIDAGVQWAEVIEAALDSATTVVAVVGPAWLTAGLNEWGERRIDDSDDWVRQELARSLASGKKIIPVRVRGAKLPPASTLPDDLKPFARLQAIEIRRDYWDHDIQLLLAQLDDRPATPWEGGQEAWPYPRRFPEGPDSITPDKLQRIIKTELDQWKVVASPLPETPRMERHELFREFQFRTFRDAIGFMTEVAPGCDIANHHPRWENIWKTVRVFLTTWDIGQRISDRDIQLARYFDRAYSDLPSEARPKPKNQAV